LNTAFGVFARDSSTNRNSFRIARISYGNSVCPSVVLVSRPGTESSPGEIETPGVHRSRVSYEQIWCRCVKRHPSIGSSSVRTVADRHRLAAYNKKALLTTFPVVPTSMTLSDLQPPK